MTENPSELIAVYHSLEAALETAKAQTREAQHLFDEAKTAFHQLRADLQEQYLGLLEQGLEQIKAIQLQIARVHHEHQHQLDQVRRALLKETNRRFGMQELVEPVVDTSSDEE